MKRDRCLTLEFAALLAVLLVGLGQAAVYLWRQLAALF